MKPYAVVLLMTAALLMVVAGKTEAQLPMVLPNVYTEIAIIEVNCTTASVTAASMVMSNNTAFVHFPAEIDMNVTAWENVTQVMVGFSTEDSFLFYLFNNTSENNAESIANTLTNQLNTVFGTSFNHNSTYTSNGYVNVTYTGVGVANLTQYTEWLMQDCLASDLGGFSLTFIPMTNETGAYTGVVALKESGGFNWTYVMGVLYFTTIPTGMGNHTINVLDLLNVESLEPSPNASMITGPTGLYASFVMLNIYSNEMISFVDCKPGQVDNPYFKGWYLYPSVGYSINAQFGFDNDPSPVNELWLSFSGVVIPEFNTVVAVFALTLTAAVAVAARSRFNRK